MAARLSITALDPNNEVPKSSIEAVVTLVWPYSSSTGQIAVLLAEKDFRLRSSRGQVRVRFTGAAGKAIALKHIGATDVVTLSLDGARWAEPLETVRTPGRSVEADLHFSNRVDILIQRESGQIEHVQIHNDSLIQPALAQNHVDSTPSTPRRNVANLPLTTPEQSKSQFAWRSPSLNFKPDADLSLDVDESEPAKKKSRTSYGSVKAWRYDDGSNDVAKVIDDEPSKAKNVAESVQEKAAPPLSSPSVIVPIENGADASIPEPATNVASMLPPPPRLKLDATNVPVLQDPSEEHSARATDPSTPVLNPVATSSLPLPSPFPNEALQEPFAGVLASSDRKDVSGRQTSVVDVAKESATKREHAKSKITTSPTTVAVDVAASRKPDAGKTSISESRPMKQTLASLFGMPSSSQVANGGSPTPSQTAAKAVLSDFELARSVLSERPEIGADENVDKDVQRSLFVTNDSESANKNVNSTSGELDVRLLRNNANTITSRRSIDLATQARVDTQTALQPSKKSINTDTISKPATIPQSTKQHVSTTPLKTPADSAAIDTMARRGSSIRAFFKRDSASDPNAPTVDSPTLAAPIASTNVATAHKTSEIANLPSSNKNATGHKDAEQEVIPQPVLSTEVQPRSKAHVPDQSNPDAEVVKNGNGEVQPQPKRTSKESAPAVSDPPHRFHENGFRTANSYFTALSAITAYMNRVQPGSGIVDVLVAVTTGTKQPQRAKSGPKDYHTNFRVADQSLQSQENTRVDIFRPRKGPLPSVAPGDVILLRDFAVKSDKHEPYLLSTGQSSWCVWRFSKLYGTIGSKKLKAALANTQWYDKYRSLEEITGIPVEYGEDERVRALKMWHWWLASRSLKNEDAE